ncbi:MAG: tRNA-dihydrouridine synthase family protein [Patescibacteria group bacterium]
MLALAPLAGFTDSAFRYICKSYGADVVYSEMASVTALNYNPDKTLKLLEFNKKERPYVVQIFGSDVNHFAKAVKILDKKINPDGYDINFGCPVKKVLKQGAGAKLMSNLELSKKIIETVLKNTKKPLSVKIRAKSFSVGALDFVKNIADLKVAAIMVHGRTLNQLFTGPIDLKLIKEIKNIFPGLVLANGGIESFKDVNKIIKETGVDGVGFGRGALGRPWIFSEKLSNLNKKELRELVIKNSIKQLKMTKKNKGELGLGEFKGHLSWYFKDFSGASKMRSEIMKTSSFLELERLLKSGII